MVTCQSLQDLCFCSTMRSVFGYSGNGLLMIVSDVPCNVVAD